ncbi:hypothetical protein CcaCcLH18_11134 [Colletotrichum camelliae]|nr:hypothetical protein CcaCcLH18_11134 [Colletotrichum camelliae]
MAIDGSDCPENSNSTDCLLRTLLQLLNDQRSADDAEVNWDPISFAFSLLLGVAAGLFALVTIWQAIVAAGKGWRKTNHSAIGHWSTRTESCWVWSEMSHRTTAWTPILNAETVARWAKPGPVQTEGKTKPLWKRTKSFLQKHVGDPCRRWGRSPGPETGNPNTENRPAATWVQLLEEIGLDKIKSPADEEKEGLRRVVADYLPDDLPAAPAYAQVGLIIAATAIVGVRSLKNEKHSAYPIIVGQGFQVDFREHPLLGVIGVYSRYEKKGQHCSPPEPKQLAMVMEYGCGRFQAMEICGSTMKTIDLLKDSKRTQPMKALMDFELPENSTYSEKFISTLEGIFEDCVPIARLFLASTPEFLPSLFPRSALTTKVPLSLIALFGSYWSSVHLSEYKGWRFSLFSLVWECPTWSRFEWKLSGIPGLDADLATLFERYALHLLRPVNKDNS